MRLFQVAVVPFFCNTMATLVGAQRHATSKRSHVSLKRSRCTFASCISLCFFFLNLWCACLFGSELLRVCLCVCVCELCVLFCLCFFLPKIVGTHGHDNGEGKCRSGLGLGSAKK